MFLECYFFSYNIYVTPISFIITILFFGVAILRYNFLSVAPIALKRVVDQMSDLYLVLNQDYIISDCNKPFENVFHTKKSELEGKNLYDLDFPKDIVAEKGSLKRCINNAVKDEKIYRLQVALKNSQKHFNVEVSGIFDDGNCIGVLILFKDITQHLIDMQNLREKSKYFNGKRAFGITRTNDWWYSTQLKNTYNVNSRCC